AGAVRLVGRARAPPARRADAEGAGPRHGRHLALRVVRPQRHGSGRGAGFARRLQGGAAQPREHRGARAIRHDGAVPGQRAVRRLHRAARRVRARHGAEARDQARL
ncbi:MAG: hypothetical protein AVDCRST_MAG27-3057, partial [uncultured Craurococcus sp.]